MRLTKFVYSLLFLPALLGSAFGGDIKFPVATIPEALTKDANLVYREDQMTFIIYSRSRAVQKNYEVITILNEKGKKAATQYVSYSKLVKINSIEGAVYNAEGKLIRKLKNNEIVDHSATGSNLFDDDRVKIADLSHSSYPYTIEFESEIEYKFLFYIPSWRVMPGEHISVQRSKWTLSYVAEAKPRFKVYNSDQQPTLVKLPDGSQSLTWLHENLPAQQREPFGPSLSEITPVIKAAPGPFVYEGYFGNMSDWKGFGLWIASLNLNRDILTEDTKRKIKELTQDKNAVEEKARVLYQFLQDKTRYVSIQIGIGGYQPFEALAVDQNSYGDCKALSNYMVALLKEAGIKANYVLIHAGDDEDDIDGSFPSTQFNHAVVAVPLEKDTLWLECTSQTNPFGYSGKFTGERHALMITDGGASIVKTPTYPQNLNRQERKALVTVNKDGSAQAKVETIYSGLQYENDNLNFYVNKSAEEQKKWILENIDLPSFEVKSFAIGEKKNKIPQATINLDLAIRNFASVSGKRLFITPNLMNRNTYVPKKVQERKTEVIKTSTYVDEDVIQLSFPEDLYPEFMPPAIHHESQFGMYDATFVMESGKLTYTRKLRMNKGRFGPETYSELVEFYKSINKADNLKLVFLSKT